MSNFDENATSVCMEGVADWMVEIIPTTDYRKRPEELPLAYLTSVQGVHVTDRYGRGCVGRLMKREK